MTIHRLHLSTMALDILDNLSALPDGQDAGCAAVAELAVLVALIQEQADSGDWFNVHLMALRAAAYALRLAEWAEVKQ